MRGVLDPNVLIAALLSRTGPPAVLVTRWLAGEFELVVSDKLLAELSRALAYPKIRKRVSAEVATAYLEMLGEAALLVPDPAEAPIRSRDPDDDYLIALAEGASAVLVSGDDDLLALADTIPVRRPADFLAELRD
ncbi:MAG: putative toxin-antitoxin system toxin component, PIN family [Gaiellaceae bacterium]